MSTVETELKFLINDAAAVEAWLDATFPRSSDQGWRTVSITDRYFDTADSALSEAGYGARLRRAENRTTLTLKADIEVDGALHRRVELEGPATRSLAPASWPRSDARDRLTELADSRRFVERVVVRQRRRERRVIVGGAEIVASIDTGVVFAAGAEAGHIAQFELELKRGRRAVLDRMARAVGESGLGQAESRSKLAMALEMSEAASVVAPGDAFVEAGRKVLHRHLLRMLDREVGTRAGDSLALKQMRVATRRMRATWRVFETGFKRSVNRRFVGQLRRLGRVLGAVRDLDVLLESLPDDQHQGPLAAHWRSRRKTSYDELMGMLQSRRYARFVEAMLEFTASPGAGTAQRSAKVSVAAMAPDAIRHAVERVRAAGAEAVDGDDATAWHALRIEARRLRYSIEAFGEVLAQRPVKELLRRLTRVQDHLGAMNDAAVAIEEASLWWGETDADADQPASAGVIGGYVSGREAEIVALRKSFGKVWRGVSGVTFERQLSLAVGRLADADEGQPLTNR
ncbi:inorganic triphosphatase [soil metagenome]